MRRLALALACAGLAALPAGPVRSQDPAGLGVYAPFGLDRAGMDPRAAPGDGFFRHVNGGWLDRTPIPPDRPLVSIDQALEDGARAAIRTILEEPDDGADPDLAKARDLYRTFLDVAAIEAAGLRPLADGLAAIRDAATLDDVADLAGRAQGGLGCAPFRLAIRPDPADPGRYAVTARQGGLGLPDRAFYVDPSLAATRDAYRAHVARLLALAGYEGPEEAAEAVLGFETALARASAPARDARDAGLTYNPVATADLAGASPFPWRRFLAAAGLAERRTIVLAQPGAVAAIGGLVAATPLPVLRAWLAAHLVDQAAPYLSDALARAHDAFRSGILAGATETPPRWVRGVALVDSLMGEAVGRAYVARHVPAGTKPAVEAMVETLRAAFAQRIARLDWLSPDARARAQDKLARMGRKVAYPDRWRGYADVALRPGDLVGSVRAARGAAWARRVAGLDRPVRRDEWFMAPQEADAAYSVTLNELVLPAAELQAPLFHPAADPAVNYGGIGAIIGHEMTHGFDDDGRRHDAEGRLAAWWSPEDGAAFDREAGRLARQLDRLEGLPGIRVDGRLVLNEAIADLGGASIALDAYHASLGGRPAPVIDGLTGDQRFFLAYGQAWRWKAREPVLRRRLASDPHAPPAIRVDATLRNMDAWYAAFAVGPGDALYLAPDARIRLW